jgi:predicted secreted acid phosphatase
MNKILFIFINIVALLIFSTAHAKEPSNLSFAKLALMQYHDSGEYLQDQTTVGQKALRFLEQRIKQPSAQPLAMVLDIDETSLSNYPDMVKMTFGGRLVDINKAVCKGLDPAIQPTLALYQFAKANHIAVFFISGRRENCKQATINNLNNVGYHDWDGLFLRPNTDHNHSVIPFKTSVRSHLTQQGYVIMLNMGDQESDLAGGYAEKTFKLPDPFYFLP